MEKLEKVLKIFTIILLTALITFMTTIAYVDKVYRSGNAEQNTVGYLITGNEKFSKLNAVYNLIDQVYYKDVDIDKLEEYAIAGLVYGLEDEYSYYMDANELSDFTVDTNGSFEGVGLIIKNNVELGIIEVMSVIKGSPAYEVGIKTGDYILEVDGVKYKGEQLSEATNHIRGEKGTEVELTVERDEKTFKQVIKRAEINIPNLEYEVLDGNIGYISIIQFDEDIAKDFDEAYDDLMSKNIKGLIIDVRDNPGGILEEVVKIADRLIPEGIIVYTVDKDGNREDYESDANRIEIPLVILTNEGSASASEILTAAIQDHGVGTVVGKQTYGKGLVQKIYGLLDGDAIKITVSEYFTPNGNNLEKNGIKPDIEVEQGEKEDTQLNKALEILKK